MKKLKLFQVIFSSVVLLSVFLLKSPADLRAQGSTYNSPITNTLYGTSDSRLTATIKQVGNQVTMTVGAVGVVVADAFEFNVLFNPDSLTITNSSFQPIAEIGTASVYPSIFTAVRLEPAVKNKDFKVSPSTAIRSTNSYMSGGTGHSVMHSIDAHIQNVETVGNIRIDIDAEEFVPLFTIFFEKANTGSLSPDAIGFNIRTALGLVRSIRWICEGGSVSYDRTLTSDDNVGRSLFSFRSPSSVQTKAVTGVAENLATFNGTFKRGEIPPVFNLLDSVASTPRTTGKLLNDSIVRYGFFYTESNIDIAFTEYSDSISINGTKYLFPTNAMIAQGYFMAGQDLIKIVETGKNSSTQAQNYSDTVTGLKSNTTYNMWAFAQYVFETSKPYPLIGIKQTFTTSQPLNIASTFVVTDPNCGKPDGSIQIHVLGGSGSYQYSLDGKNYTNYPNGLITGLNAGSYRIYVRDAFDTLYLAAVSPEIILQNAGNDLTVDVAVTDASNCVAENGILHVSAGGGMAPYTYTLNGKSVSVVNGQIANLGAGVYVLNVTDYSGCTVTSGEVQIGAGSSLFALKVDSVTNTECNEETGAIYFKVTGTNYYKYQLDGMSLQTATDNNQIALRGLLAGSHTLRVFDTCGNEQSQTLSIYNHDKNGFAVTHTAKNVKVDCSGNIAKGSITLTAFNGAPNYKYTIDGNNWNYFPTGKDSVTITNLREGIYYVQVMDTNGTKCIYEINSIVIEKETTTPLNLLAGFSSTNPACGTTNGEIQVYAAGGSGSYKYSVNGGTFQNYNNGVITGLGAGTYQIKVQDANDINCAVAQMNDVVLYNKSNSLNLTVVPVDASTCTPAGDGQLFVSVNGGSGNYQYKWADGTMANVVNGKIDNLSAGVYVLKVTDLTDNCVIASNEVRISSTSSNLKLEIMDSTATICGSSVGTVTFRVTGSSNYTYQLDGMPMVTSIYNNAIVLSGLSAGVHTLRVFDNCAEIVRQIVITNDKTSGLAFTAKVENVKLACDGSIIDGKIFVTATKGVHDLTCFIDGEKVNFAAGKDTLTLFVSEGKHHISVQDNAGCTYEYNLIEVRREIIPALNVGTIHASTNPSCAADGAIQFYVSGGSGQYQYKYTKDGGNLSNVSAYTNGLISNLAAGSYKIYVWDVNYPTCAPAVSADVVLTNSSSNFAVHVIADSASDCVKSDGTLYVSVSGGSGNYNYYLNGTNESPVNDQYKKPAGVYTLEVRDGNNCVVSSGEVRIASKTSTLDITVNNVVNTVCGISTGTIKFTVSGSNAYSYQLDGTPAVNVAGNNPITLGGLNAGIHTLRVFDNCGEVTKHISISNGTTDLAFTNTVDNLGCSEEKSIILTVSNGTPPYKYSLDNGSTWSASINSTTITIDRLKAGNYDILLKDDAGCKYANTQVRIEESGLIAPPSATTPQVFCSGATVNNLQATGTGIKWYLSAIGGTELNPLHQLDSGRIYYAAQTIGACESTVRTAVKAIINSEIMLDAPSIAYNQSFCKTTSNLTLADIATNGNTNIVWYNQAVGGTELPLTTPLSDATSYFAVQAAGSCQSAVRAEVYVTLGSTAPDSVVIPSPQYFCEGSLIANIAVPHNQIVWYTEKTGGSLLTAETVLRDGAIYYAAYKTGDCQSINRTPVQVFLTTPKTPIVPSPQTVCGGKQVLADLMVTGSGIVWYDSDKSTTPLSPNTQLSVGKTYYAAQSSVGCQSDRAAVRITDTCFTIKGTVFPFVHTGDAKFDTLFPITVKLYPYPTSMDCDDPLSAVFSQSPVSMTMAKHHDGSEWIPNTPKNPGVTGAYNNPGLPIDWIEIGKTAGAPDSRLLVKGLDTIPSISAPGSDIGKYALEDVPPARYLLVISRQGFITRIGEILVTGDGYVCHRELVPGEVDGDLIITSSDPSAVKARFSNLGDPKYNPKHDLNGDAVIDSGDLDITKANIPANFMIYKETNNWIFKKCN